MTAEPELYNMQTGRASATPPTLLGTDTGTAKLLSGTTLTNTAEYDQLPAIDTSFTTVRALFAYVDVRTRADDSVDTVAVAEVSPADFAVIDKSIQAKGRKWRVFFFAQHRLLIITVPNEVHELLHVNLYQVICNHILHMGLSDGWRSTAGSRYPVPAPPAASQGEGDSGGGPWPTRPRGAWPTLIIESGWSQPLVSLRAKIRFWFATSTHAVKIVLLVKAFPDDHTQKRILVEQWQEQLVSDDRPGATTTRSAASTIRLAPVCVQTINIVWALAGVAFTDASVAQQSQRESYNVVRGPLRLDFELLFLRAPGPNEHDVVVLESQLQLFAAVVWTELPH